MKKTTWLAGLAAAAVVQLGVPAGMIWNQEHILRNGEPFKFKTAPVDPYDAFRGRYLAIRFESNSVPVSTNFVPRRGDRVFVGIERDDEGFARFATLSLAPPGGPHLRTAVSWVNGGQAVLKIPFNRYYIDEELAPGAEQAYRDANRGGATNDAYVVLRVLRGAGALEELYIGDVGVRDLVTARRK
jgi:uncharacterized membrane-anchored protein